MSILTRQLEAVQRALDYFTLSAGDYFNKYGDNEEPVSTLSWALATADEPTIDEERLARAICASRPPEEPDDLADALFIDDECRGIARRAVAMYARLAEGQP